MPTVEISAQGQRLTRALLLYEGGGKTVATSHAVKDGTILPGEPIDLPSLRRSLDDPDLLKNKKRAGAFHWHFPRLLAEHPEWNLWWSPAGVRSVFVAGKPRKAWLPMLVWMGHRVDRRLFLFAAREPADPRPETIVFRPKFGPAGSLNHIFDDSGVCLGSMTGGNHTPAAWEDDFWSTNFKTDGNLSAKKPYKIEKVFKKLGPLADIAASIAAHRQATH